MNVDRSPHQSESPAGVDQGVQVETRRFDLDTVEQVSQFDFDAALMQEGLGESGRSFAYAGYQLGDRCISLGLTSVDVDLVVSGYGDAVNAVLRSLAPGVPHEDPDGSQREQVNAASG